MNPKRIFATPVILASILGLFAVPVLAAQQDCGPRWTEHRAERMEQNHQKLHDALKLNPDQDVAWKKMIAVGRPMIHSKQGNREDWAKLTTPQRGEKRLQHLKAEQAFVADHVAALNDFYSVLMPEQKVVFDEFHSGMRHGMRGKQERRSTKTAKPAATQ